MVGEPAAWIAATGIKPKSLDDILAAQPAGVQDRWFARLYLLKPLAIGTLALFWFATGVIALGPGRAPSMAHLHAAGVEPPLDPVILIGGRDLRHRARTLAVVAARDARGSDRHAGRDRRSTC